MTATSPNLVDLSAKFKALGDPTRLRIYEFLRACDEPIVVTKFGVARSINGSSVGEICCHITGLDKISSTISHHLKELRNAGLITVERRGKNMIYSINPLSINCFSSYFADELHDTESEYRHSISRQAV